jgi:hypothetical protein
MPKTPPKGNRKAVIGLYFQQQKTMTDHVPSDQGQPQV